MERTEEPDALDESRALTAFAERVRELREQRGWSFGDAEAVSGVTRSHWHKLESGSRQPGLLSLLRIQRAFGLSSLDALFGPLPTQQFFTPRPDAGKGPDTAPDV